MSGRDRRGVWTGWLLPGAGLVVAVVIVVWTFVSTQPPATVPLNVSPSPAGDEHEVATDGGRYWFGLDGADLVVRRLTHAAAIELGRVAVFALASIAPGESPRPQGTGMYVMVCPSGDGMPQRFVFGYLDTTRSIEYSGPEADGQGASDGLFLFVIRPAADAGRVEVTGKGPNQPMAGMGDKAFAEAASEGTRQDSGCFVLE